MATNDNARRRGWAAAFLNASGLGAGYLYLGARWLAAANLAGTLLLIIIANLMNADDTPGAWLAVYALWLLAAALHARLLAVPRPRPAATPPPGPSPAPEPTAWGGESPTMSLRTPGPLPPMPPMPPTPPPPPVAAPGWRAYATGAALLVLVAAAVTVVRAVPQAEFEAGQDDHAAGDCAAAIDHYDQVGTAWSRFALPAAPDAAARERARCLVLQDAVSLEDAGRLPAAIDRYQDYLDRYDGGGPVWTDGESHLATLRMDHAELLADRALADEGSTGGDRYAAAIDAYAAIGTHHPDSEQAGRVQARVDALYAEGTASYGRQEFCAAIDQLLPFAALDESSEAPAAGELAGRADEELPEAYFGCGESLRAEGRDCAAQEPFQGALDVGREGASQALNEARFDCGTTRVGSGQACKAVGDFEAVDGGGLVNRADNALRGALYDCGVAQFRDRAHDAARDSLQRVVDEYGGSRDAELAGDLLIAVDVNEANGRDPGGLLPGGSFAESGGGGQATTYLYNTSDEAVEVLYAGAAYGVITLPAGPGGGEAACDTASPSQVVDVPAGDYQVLVRGTSGSDATPLTTVWHNDAGDIWDRCYWVESGYGFGDPSDPTDGSEATDITW